MKTIKVSVYLSSPGLPDDGITVFEFGVSETHDSRKIRAADGEGWRPVHESGKNGLGSSLPRSPGVACVNSGPSAGTATYAMMQQ